MWNPILRKRAIDEIDHRRNKASTFTEPLKARGRNEEMKAFLLDFYKRIYQEQQRADYKQELALYRQNLGVHYKLLVPELVSFEDFWQRYEYRCHLGRVMQELREQDAEASKKSMQDSLDGVKNLFGSIQSRLNASTRTINEKDNQSPNSTTAAPEKATTAPEKASANEPLDIVKGAKGILANLQNYAAQAQKDPATITSLVKEEHETPPEATKLPKPSASKSTSTGTNETAYSQPKHPVSKLSRVLSPKEKEEEPFQKEIDLAKENSISTFHKSRLLSLFLVAAVTVVVLGITLQTPMMKDLLCGPIRPGIILGALQPDTQGESEAPWWARDSVKAKRFDLVCSRSSHSRAQIQWNVNRFKQTLHVTAIDLDNGIILMDERGLVSATIHAKDIVFEKKNTKEVSRVPWKK
jgi:hypothetical protein